MDNDEGAMLDGPQSIERRRRQGARRLSFKWAKYAANALRGRIGRTEIVLDDDVIIRISYYVFHLREDCYHFSHLFLRCPVCHNFRCSICGCKFLVPSCDPQPCRCVRRSRRSRRLAALTAQSSTGGPFPAVLPLHAAFPELYGVEQ